MSKEKFKVLSLPLLRLRDNVPVFVTFLELARFSAVKSKTRQPDAAARCLNLESKEEADLLMPRALRLRLEEVYKRRVTLYRGKSFKLIRHARGEKRASEYTIAEIIGEYL